MAHTAVGRKALPGSLLVPRAPHGDTLHPRDYTHPSTLQITYKWTVMREIKGPFINPLLIND